MISQRQYYLLTRISLGIAALVSSLQGNFILSFTFFIAWGWIEIITFRGYHDRRN